MPSVQLGGEPHARSREDETRLDEVRGTEVLGKRVGLGVAEWAWPVAAHGLRVDPGAGQDDDVGCGRQPPGEHFHQLSVRQALPSELGERHHGDGHDRRWAADTEHVGAAQVPADAAERHRNGRRRRAPPSPGTRAGPVHRREPRRDGPGPLIALRGERGDERRGHGCGYLRTGAAQRTRQRGAVSATGGPRTRERLEGHDGQRVEVRPTVELFAPDLLLGRHVAGRADRYARRGERGARRPHHVRHAEIREERAARVLVDQDVRRLHVAVHHATLVGVVQRRADLARHAQAPRERRATRREHALVGDTPHERHDQKRDPGARAEVVNGHDMRVGQGRRQRGFLLEPLEPHFAGGDLGWQHLDRHDVTERAVARAVDEAHATGAHGSEQLVAIADGALHVCGVGRLHARAESIGACPPPHSAR